MYLSNFFLPVLKETPSEAQIASHRLMLRCGMIKQSSAGIYSWLPLGLKVLKNVENIIRKNMDEAGLIELLMPCIQDSKLWAESKRYDDYGPEMLRVKDRHNNELLFGPTAEEVLTSIARSYIKSYKDLPKIFYQIQWKFRDEIRPRFGVMRGREFYMKDAYSLDLTREDAISSYNKVFRAYIKTFYDMGLKVVPVKADGGVIGGSHNHEFHVVADTGESGLYYDKRFDSLKINEITPEILESIYTASSDIHDKNKCQVPEDYLIQRRGIEVGHIFYFGTKYSESMKAYVNNSEGKQVPLQMGSYGIGVSRLVGAIIEANHDEKGIIWPENVAPFKVSIINLLNNNEEAIKISKELHEKLDKIGMKPLFDDMNTSPGSKFATHDLIGSPKQIIIGKKYKENKKVELKDRKTGESLELSVDEIINKLSI